MITDLILLVYSSHALRIIGSSPTIIIFIINFMHALINPRRACAARVTAVVLCVCVFVYLCVCLFVSDYSRTTGYEVAYEQYQPLQGKTAFERYGVKTSEKANMHNEHWFTSTRFSPFSASWTN